MKMDKAIRVKDAKYQISHVTDDNGEIFPVSEEIIRNVVSDGCCQAKYPIDQLSAVKNNIVVKDKLGMVIDRNKYIASIKDSTSNTSLPSAIDVIIESTHDGENLNSEIYNGESMKKDAATFTQDYPKPMLKNHNVGSCEPLGRITNSEYGPSHIVANKNTIRVKAHITDKDAIEKILDGRLHTVSIGAMADSIKCGFCGADILKDGNFQFCGHWRGRSYKTQDGQAKMCNWKYSDMHYNELSFVNEPADVYAQVTGIEIPDSELSDFRIQQPNQNLNNNQQNTNPNTIVNFNLGNGIGSTIDSLLNGGNQQPQAQQQNNSVNNNTLQNQIAELQNQLSVKDTELASVQAENKILKDNQANSQTVMLQMASDSKNILVDSILNFELMKGTTPINAKDSRKVVLMSQTYDSLKTMFEGLDFSSIQNSNNIPRVNNPGQNNPKDQHVVNNEPQNNNYGFNTNTIDNVVTKYDLVR